MGIVSYGRAITQRAQEDPDRVAVVCGDKVLSRALLESRSNRMARAFTLRGVEPGRLVTIGLPNCLEFVIACVATWKCGAIPNPISPRLPARERSGILELASPALVVGFDDLVHEYPALPADFEPPSESDDAPLPDVVSPHERAMATGGSTGRPKLILLRVPAEYDPERPATILTPKGSVLVPGPLYHAAPFGSLTQGLLTGEKIVLMRRFDASQCLELIERHAVDQILFVPTMMHRIWRLPEEERRSRDVSSLRMVLTGSAPCPQWLMRGFIDWLGPDVMHEVYGGSERIGGTFITGREWLEHPGSVGKPTRATRIRILDPETRVDLPTGEIGEIYIMPAGGPGSTYEYVGASSQATDDGWESVGDMGRLDADGYLYLADRRTDMILCGGRNIYPAQVEAAIEEHPAIASSAVIGLPDEDMGQIVHAIVQTSAPVSEEELRTHLKERLVHYAIPRTFELVDTALRDEAGKVRRWALRAERVGG
ncbi:MAG: AMP-binding protein [Deltaproteobacteria bacterium]|nr:AMP-binding protein [Deltaproteobacteria bacterium]